MINFCHLHVHNEFSFLDGYGSAKAYIKKAKELGMTHLALTNHANVAGNLKFQFACKEAGITAVHGCELYIVPDLYKKNKGDKRGHITVLVKNEVGWENLCKMISIANLEGFYYRPRVDYKTFLNYCEGLVVLTGCSNSFLMKDSSEQATDFLVALYEKIGSDLYLEIQPHKLTSQLNMNALCLDFKDQIGDIKLVATNDCHYIEKDDNKTHDVLLCIQTKKKITDTDRMKLIDGLYLRSSIEMDEAFIEQAQLAEVDYLEAMANTMEVAEKCTFQIQKKEISLPLVPGYEEEEPGKFIWDLAEKELLKIGNGWATEKLNQYFDRLREEWKLINDKKFSIYFMIVWAVVDWCKKNNIMVGPARGSAGGSLLAYLLNITTSMDPIEYGLLFSRFISEDRIDYPDIDLDFEDRKRGEVRKHLENLFGIDRVSSLSTFLTMKGRGVIRDVARAFDVPLKEVDEFAKSIVEDKDSDFSSIEVAAQNHWFAEKYPEVIKYAIKLEGQVRGVGQHASAVIISKENLRDGTRGTLFVQSDERVLCWDMKDSEYIGVMKLDVLGLNNLSILSETKDLILENTDPQKVFFYHPESDCYWVGSHDENDGWSSETDFDFPKIPLNDETVYESLARGETNGVFQLSAWPTTKLAMRLKPTNIYELSDVIALVRPGPAGSGMTESYIRRKNEGEKWVPIHPIYEQITANTFGNIVYQEQVMEVIYKVAGLPYVTADKIRKIIGKKRDAKEFAPYKEAFVNGCLSKKTLTKKQAEDFWTALEEHANYSFNRSHSMAYAIFGYWCAWCKVHYPVEFICSALTYGAEGKKNELIKEAMELGFKIIPPKIGISDSIRWIAKGECIYVPFKEINGIGDTGAKKCGELRAKKKVVHKGFWPQRKNENAIKVEDKKINEILMQIGAYSETVIPDNIGEFFSFEFVAPSKKDSYMIKEIIPECDGSPKWNSLNITEPLREPLIIERSFRTKRSLGHCKDCGLRDQCTAPVHPSPGIFNVAIVGEAPGHDEDYEGKGFVGRSGKMIWDGLIQYSLKREDFHVSNCCKCYPSQTRTPTSGELERCSEKWLFPELKEIQCKLILAVGASAMEVFTGKKSGITKMSGTTEWCDKIGAWVCYCVHPSFVLHKNSEENRELFAKGIANFIEKISLIQ